MGSKHNLRVPPGYKVIFRPYTTINGKRIYAWQKGLKAFPLVVKDD